MKQIVHTLLCTALLSTMAWAQDSQTPKKETLSQAIQFEKYKVASAEAQARKDAAEQRKTTTSSKKAQTRKQGQADSSQADKAKQ